MRLRSMSSAPCTPHGFGASFEALFATRVYDADAFYNAIAPENLDWHSRMIMRQAFAGLLWSKQFYNFCIKEWLDGDPAFGAPPAARKSGRNSAWGHLYNADVISMPDKWEYPWYAAWDLAFHCVRSRILIRPLPRINCC